MRESSVTARRLVFERDRGICLTCGFDAARFDRIITDARLDFGQRWLDEFDTVDGVSRAWNLIWGWMKREMGLPPNRNNAFWDAHHVESVFDGGGSKGVKNLVTLCTDCHKDVTKKQAKKIGRARRLKKKKEMRKRYGNP